MNTVIGTISRLCFLYCTTQDTAGYNLTLMSHFACTVFLLLFFFFDVVTLEPFKHQSIDRFARLHVFRCKVQIAQTLGEQVLVLRPCLLHRCQFSGNSRHSGKFSRPRSILDFQGFYRFPKQKKKNLKENDRVITKHIFLYIFGNSQQRMSEGNPAVRSVRLVVSQNIFQSKSKSLFQHGLRV